MGLTCVEVRGAHWVSYRMESRHKKTKRKISLKDRITKDASSLGVNNEEELAHDKDGWKEIVVATMTPSNP